MNDDNGQDYPDGPWADGWDERFSEFLIKDLKMLEKDRIYIVNTEEHGDIESVWDGEDFYPNENIDANCSEGIVISGAVIGDPFNNKFKIKSIRTI